MESLCLTCTTKNAKKPLLVNQFLPQRVGMCQVATGEEGYRASGAEGAWMDDGTKGLDFGGNLACAAVDFATVHLCRPPWALLGPLCLCRPQSAREPLTSCTPSHFGAAVTEQVAGGVTGLLAVP